jgi:hypothetical protein
MTRETARSLNEEFGQMVEEFCRKHNLEKINCRLTYTDASLDWKVTTKALDANGERKIDPALENRAKWFITKNGIKAPEKVLGTYVEVSGLGRCKIKDFNSRSPKYAFSVETASGKVYRTTVWSLKF